MSRYWSDLARELKPYVPGEQPRIPDLVKLNTNESPLGPSTKVADAIAAAAAGEALRLYPDPDATALREALAAYHGVTPAQVFLGNGSDEVIAHAFAALLNQPRPLLFPDVTYSFYPVWARLLGVAYETVPLTAGFRIDPAGYAGAGAIILPNPNAPTGVALTRAEIAALLGAHHNIPVVIDEAYVDFGGESAIPLIADHPNLLVVQTMSKSRALAGLRVGYALGHRDLIEALVRVKDSFNSYPLGRPAQAGALASIADEAHFQESRAAVIAGRARMAEGLAALGFDVLPSAANFVFARHPAHPGEALAAALRERAILVRRWSAPRIADHLRISVGTEVQIERLLAALAEILR